MERVARSGWGPTLRLAMLVLSQGLADRLARAGCDGRRGGRPGAPGREVADRYDVSLSFAGEDRPYVERVAAELTRLGVRVFYDSYEEVELWGKDLYRHLDEVYRIRAEYCVVFSSSAYAHKLWTTHELRSAQIRASEENREYILPARLDTTEIPGIPPTIGYIDVSHMAPDQFARLVAKKVALRRPKPVG